ncbi:hypothetical protein J5N97_016004 [Dioscorea zingiberensis]|uniref:Uncharacterized protein n=1 Tax=Dioscorea zingiberensis TaxID=325984 RepID=A0A9D5CJG0_9LILI|nr:hypothetical protein J5N97_016004 [Dioscorea zingiberensis]
MMMEDCPALLHHVGVLPSLQNLEWCDSSMMFLPDLMLPYSLTAIFPTLQRIFIVVGDVLTLRRFLINGPDWPKIQHIPNVSIEVMDRPEFISYTKEPFSFRTNIDAVVDAPPPPLGHEWLHSLYKLRICVLVYICLCGQSCDATTCSNLLVLSR